jgi:hypothetical protein
LTALRLVTELLDEPITIELDDDGPSLNAEIIKSLPLHTTLGHVVVSGGGIWLPTRYVFTAAPNWVQRRRGTMYFYAPGQSICITYGAITESANVNRLGEVIPEDLGRLTYLGEAIWKRTIDAAQRPPVQASLASAS